MPQFYKENIEKTETKISKELNTRINSSSQLHLYPVMYDQNNNEKFLNIFRFYEVDLSDKKNSSYIAPYPYECEDDDWFDNISATHYEISELWWCICLINSIQNPFEEIEEGKLLHILNPQKLFQLYKEIDHISGLK